MATLKVYMPSVVNSITFTNGNTAVNRDGYGTVSFNGGTKISSVSMAGSGLSWSGTLYWSNGTNSYAFARVSNGTVSVYSAASQEEIEYFGNNREITVSAVAADKIFYYQYRYLEQDGTQISDSFIYAKSESSEAPYTSVTLSSIPAPSTGNWKKTGQYFGIAYCTILYSQDSARCTSTSTSDPSIIGVYCSKATIDLFTWTGSDASDTTVFARGESISSALTATRWNNLLAKIKEVAEANGGSFTYSTVSRGDKILATTFNAARTGISNLSGHGTLPSAQSKGNNILAALFVGTTSLKSALNAAINAYNNS